MPFGCLTSREMEKLYAWETLVFCCGPEVAQVHRQECIGRDPHHRKTQHRPSAQPLEIGIEEMELGENPLIGCPAHCVLIVGGVPSRTNARKQTYRETPPGPNNFTPIGSAFPAAFGMS